MASTDATPACVPWDISDIYYKAVTPWGMHTCG